MLNFGILARDPSTATGTVSVYERRIYALGVIESNLQLLPDSLAVHREWRRIVVDYAVSGVQVYDARLAAAMRVHGVRKILTFNQRDFVRYSDIQALHPQTLVQENP